MLTVTLGPLFGSVTNPLFTQSNSQLTGQRSFTICWSSSATIPFLSFFFSLIQHFLYFFVCLFVSVSVLFPFLILSIDFFLSLVFWMSLRSVCWDSSHFNQETSLKVTVSLVMCSSPRLLYALLETLCFHPCFSHRPVMMKNESESCDIFQTAAFESLGHLLYSSVRAGRLN